MRILVHEFESGGGHGRGPAVSPLAREGAAMRAALLADLVAIAGNEVAATADPRLSPPTPAGVRVLSPVAGTGAAFRAMAAAFDAVWLIAPETHGVLAHLAAAVERAGGRLLGSGARAVQRAAAKLSLARILTARGIPTPRTVLLTRSDAALIAARLGYPLVVKPLRGAGCSGVTLARHAGKLDAAVAAARAAHRHALIAQPYIDGSPASVTLVCDGARAVPLAVNAQSVRPGVPFRYDGGETPLQHPLAGLAAERAVAACIAIGGLVGIVGVDVVLTNDDVVVIEVNPRLTTSYLGVRLAIDGNVAAIAIAACNGSLPVRAPVPTRRVRFTGNGVADVVEAVA